MLPANERPLPYFQRAALLVEDLDRAFEVSLTATYYAGGRVAELSQRYGLAVTPILELVDPQPLDRSKMNLLLAGISESVEGYPPLENVPAELEAVQSLGGNGYINDYPAGRLLRDAKLYEIGAGTSEIRRMLIGRELFRDTMD